MIQWFDQWARGIVTMAGGPAHLRFILQPVVALLLGLRDGRLDARAGTAPFLWNLLFVPSQRRASWRSAVGALWKPFLVATVMDAFLQMLILRTLHPGQAALTGCLLVGLPYAVTRALTNRAVSHRHRHPPFDRGEHAPA